MNLQQIASQFPSCDDFVKALIQEVIKLGKEKPDFKYTNSAASVCFYNGPAKVYNNSTQEYEITGPECKGCIFGQALQNMGWDDEKEMKLRVDIEDLLYSCVSEELKVPEQLLLVQRTQDVGPSWGDCIKLLRVNNG
jgi:hypothetical protein